MICILVFLFSLVSTNAKSNYCQDAEVCIKVITNCSSNESSCTEVESDLKNCCSLKEAFNIVQSNTKLIIDGTASLNHFIKFDSSISDLYIQGANYINDTINCDNGGLGFYNIKNLFISNLTVTRCGGYHSNHFGSSYREIPAIHIENCINVNIDSTIVTNNSAIGMNLTNIRGIITITNSRFEYNDFACSKCQVNNFVQGGGGILIYQNLKLAADGNAVYNIFQSNFTANTKNATRNETLNKFSYGLAHGGGLEVKLESNMLMITVLIEYCKFSNNEAIFGGGAAVYLKSSVNNSNIIISKCNFTSNRANKNSIIANGGGLQILFFAFIAAHNNSITISDCNFHNNSAYFGGGMSIASSSAPPQASENFLNIENCHWNNNTATSGAAVDVSHHFYDTQFSSNIITPVFKNCTFCRNSIKFNKTLKESVGYGAMSVTMMNVIFKSYTKFQENVGSAISASRASLNFDSCHVEFINNTGVNGGAVTLMELAAMNFSNETSVLFKNNYALNNGGAVYSVINDDHMLFSRAGCPFVFTDNCSFITFDENNASNRGQAIYLSSLIPCKIIYGSVKCQSSSLFQRFYFKDADCESEIATAPSTYTMSDKPPIHAYPGEMTKINLKFYDSMNKSIEHVTLQVSIFDPQGNTSLQHTLKEKYISRNKFAIMGPPNGNVLILFQTIEKPLLNIVVNVKTRRCPISYFYDKANKTCKCAAAQYYGVYSCSNGNHYKAVIKSGTWYGRINNSEFYTGPCRWFCYPKSNEITMRIKDSKQEPCRLHHRGILCSRCDKGYTVYYHSITFHCGSTDDCKWWNWLFFIGTDVLPITLVLIVIIFTGFNVTSGYVQGFLLYSHILCSLSLKFNGIINTRSLVTSIFKYSLEIFYLPLDLKFFHFPNFNYCIFSSGRTLDIVSLRYFKGFYGLALILIIVAFIKCFAVRCNRCLRFTTAKNSALLGMSALLVLSFTSVIEISLTILQPSPLYQKDFSNQLIRVALYGEWDYFGSGHLPYAISALIIAILIILPVLMLFLYPLVSQFLYYFRYDADHSWQGVILTKCFMYYSLKPFYDMFYADFKDEHRYFAGLYLIYRAIIQFCYYLPNYTQSYFTMEIFLVSFLIIHAFIQPYQKKIHNMIDAILLGFLVIVNGLTCVHSVVIYDTIHRHYWDPVAGAIVQMIFALLPMYFIICYFTWKYILKRLWRYFKARRGYQELLNSNRSVELYHNRQYLMRNNLSDF